MHELYELKEMLCKELEEYGRKGEISAGSLDTVDKLAHTVKNLGKIISMYDGDDRGGSYGYYYADGGRRGGTTRRGANQYGSYGMGYSRNESVTTQLRELMDSMPDEHLRSKMRDIISRMENR